MSSDESGAGVREGLIWMNGDGGRGWNVDSLFNLCDRGVSARISNRPRNERTSERFELEGLYFGDDVFVLVGGEVVVLDEMHDVGESEHSGEALGGRIVKGS